jgi:hypothetical protein
MSAVLRDAFPYIRDHIRAAVPYIKEFASELAKNHPVSFVAAMATTFALAAYVGNRVRHRQLERREARAVAESEQGGDGGRIEITQIPIPVEQEGVIGNENGIEGPNVREVRSKTPISDDTGEKIKND